MIRHEFLTIQLNPDQLSKPFKINTNWQVITGAPCSGKTTLITQLADNGYNVIQEGARMYFERGKAQGMTVEEIYGDGVDIQYKIAELQMQFESEIQGSEIVFLDRALPDSLTFFRIVGMDPNKLLPHCFTYHYASVFILDQLPFLRDETLGPEDSVSATLLDEWLERDYSALGYSVIRIPVMSPQERLKFVLERIS